MSDPIPPDLPESRAPELTSPHEAYKQAIKPFESFIDGQALGSVRSNAFCDFVDFKRAEERAEGNPDDIGALMKRELVGETMRQRRNEVPSYDAMLGTLVRSYETLILAGSRIGYRPENVLPRLNGLKAEHIEKSTLPSEPEIPQAPTASPTQAASSGEML